MPRDPRRPYGAAWRVPDLPRTARHSYARLLRRGSGKKTGFQNHPRADQQDSRRPQEGDAVQGGSPEMLAHVCDRHRGGLRSCPGHSTACVLCHQGSDQMRRTLLAGKHGGMYLSRHRPCPSFGSPSLPSSTVVQANSEREEEDSYAPVPARSRTAQTGEAEERKEKNRCGEDREPACQSVRLRSWQENFVKHCLTNQVVMETSAWKAYETARCIPREVAIDIPPDARILCSTPCTPRSATSPDPFAAGPSTPIAIPNRSQSFTTRTPGTKAEEMSEENSSVGGGCVRNDEIEEVQSVDAGEGVEPSTGWSTATVHSLMFRLTNRDDAEDDVSHGFSFCPSNASTRASCSEN